MSVKHKRKLEEARGAFIGVTLVISCLKIIYTFVNGVFTADYLGVIGLMIFFSIKFTKDTVKDDKDETQKPNNLSKNTMPFPTNFD